MLLRANTASRVCCVIMFVLLMLLCLDGVAANGTETCETNLDCCRHLPGSAEFKKCCSEGCCPDCDAVTYVAAMKSYAMMEGCEASYECCVYKVQSDEWRRCCSKHICCMLCHDVSKGCCYSGRMYKFGSVVEDLTVVNTNLVCGARMSADPPYFAAAVVPVLIPHQSTGFEKCGDQEKTYCVEERGVIHVNGSEWFRDTCRLCRCEEGLVTCHPVKPPCPPAPHPLCVSVPSDDPEDCCNAWDCSRLETMCHDAYGQVREEGEQWSGRNDPCLLYMCKPGGMVLSARRSCPPPRRYVPPGCEEKKRPDECCSVLSCPECTGENGVSYSAGDTWADPADPCYTMQCLAGGAVNRVRKQCPVARRPSKDNCVLTHQDCCPTWVCGGCVDRYGKLHALGSTWTDPGNPCITYQCSDRGTRLVQKDDCKPLGLKPEHNCQRIKKDCCYVWNCVGDKTHCVDDQGVERRVGEEWYNPDNLCIQCRCTEDLTIVKAIRDCARPVPKPSPDCIMEVTSCCPFWSCPCVDALGVERAVGDVWKHPTNECVSLECTRDGVRQTPVACPQMSLRPNPRCVMHFDGCCPAWNCPAACPDPFSFNRNCFQYFDQCYSDHNCRAGERCCLVAGCGRECMASKVGQCPVIRFIVAPQCDYEDKIDACQTDQQCPGTQKCCFVVCNKQCVDPI
ncbi:kielin/chordin-like protein [Eriocheir sinensis]|uniref:kielin/chordin-like protein n=1 Tax=Eriocheir sinensis TaxID=95602 RepID=UPI0021C822E0|nr:kielin/chordin-like protein [Eriocheir sinensis]XP_050723636.1 kielin/chordin-like protein [Eriocheir sinensis]